MTRPATVHYIRRRAVDATTTASERLRTLGLDAEPLAESVRAAGRLTVNFHPDRLDRLGRTVAAGLLADGRYRNQYATGISNGGRSAVDGGSRPRWEADLFGRLPDDIGDRPIYGALDLTRDPHGGSPRFGSSFLVLHHRCADRTTFCVGDSHTGPTDVGTIDELTPILAGVFERAASGDGLDRGLSIDGLHRLIVAGADRPARSLDGYVEAQIHGDLDLRTDVVTVVLDPSFRGSEVEADIEAAAMRYDVGVAHHTGSELPVDQVPSDFRGPEMFSVARRAARPDAVVDAASIGLAVNTVPYSPPLPRGDPDDTPRQRYKQLWHCVLRFGTDAGRTRLID